MIVSDFNVLGLVLILNKVPMHFFAEAICILLRLYAGLCENIDHLSPAEARAGTELGNKNINVF